MNTRPTAVRGARRNLVPRDGRRGQGPNMASRPRGPIRSGPCLQLL